MKILLPTLLLLAGFGIINYFRRRMKITAAFTLYQNALNGSSLSDALKAGRNYYALLKNEELDMMDEYLIAADLKAARQKEFTIQNNKSGVRILSVEGYKKVLTS